MNNGSFHQNSTANHILRPQHLPPAITYGPAPEAETRTVEGKCLTPAITYGPETEPGPRTAEALPEREVVFVGEKEAAVLQMAESIERECYREAMSACEEGMRPAVYDVTGRTETERAILTMANSLPKQYQKERKLSIPPILLPSPQRTSTAISDVRTCVTAKDAQAKDTANPAAAGHLGTCVYTDMELAQLFIRRVPVRRKGQQVYIFNGAYYHPLTENELHAEIVKNLRNEIGVSGRAQKIRSVADALLVEPDILVRENERNSGKVCLLNGILDMGTRCLHRHTPMCFIDWQLNSLWGGNNADCPNFDRFLWDVTEGDPVLLERFWQATGYLLVGEGNIAKRVFILIGPSDAGKSVYGSLLRGFHHPEQISSIDAFKLGDRFAASALVNARLNLAMDLPYGSLHEQAVGMIKSISGSDAVTVEAKYRAPYTAKLDCKLVFGTNHPIRATVADKALARRLMVLPFRNPVPKSRQDPYLLDRLLEERPAILERAVQAYYRLRANNYVFEGDDRFDNDAILGITDGTAVPKDVMEQFVNICCADAPGQFLSTGQLYEAYQVFCQSKGVSCIEDCQRFSARLHPVLEEKFQATRSKRRVGGIPSNGYLGVQLILGSS